MPDKRVIIIAGPSGAGKSTFARENNRGQTTFSPAFQFYISTAFVEGKFALLRVARMFHKFAR